MMINCHGINSLILKKIKRIEVVLVGKNKKRYHKIFNSAISASLVTSAMVAVAPASAGAEEISFKDVKSTDYFYEAVKSLTSRGIIGGYEDVTYRPYTPVTRAEAAKILALTLGLDTKNVKNPGFSDVKTTDWHYGPIAALVERGVFGGYEDSTFRPDGTLTRAELAKMIALGFKLDKEPLTNTPFTDVKTDDWFANDVHALVTNGITSGKTATTYAPKDSVTRGEIASFVFRSENAIEITELQSEIINITTTSVELKDGTYAITNEMKKWLNPANLSVLKGAILNVDLEDSKINKIKSLELTASGKSGEKLVLDGQGSAFEGDLFVNVDYISIKDLTIEGDLEIGPRVESSFYTENITVKGTTKVSAKALTANSIFKTLASGRSTVAAVSAAPTVAAASAPVIVFVDSNINTVEITNEGIILESKGSTTVHEISATVNVVLKADKGIVIPKVTIKEGVGEVTIDAEVDSLSVEASDELTIKGTGNIKTVTVQSSNAVNIETVGKIEKLKVKSKESKISLGKSTEVGDIAVPEGSDEENIVDGGKSNSSSGGSNNDTDDDDDDDNDNVTPDKNYTLSLMHTNDTHASLDNAAKTVTAVKSVRAEKPNALLLNAGDVFSGTLYFNEFQGQADLQFMNLMKYDAMTFGNHEFDLGSSEEGHQALADFIVGANFPFVSANVNFLADEKFTGLFSDLISSKPENGKIYNGIIKEVNGEKVGIFGLTTEETKDLSSPGAITFEEYLAEAKKAVAAFENQGVDKIVAITHIGYDDNANVDNDLMLAAKVEGIDVIVGGHSHTALSEPKVVANDKTPTVIVQTGANNSNLGVLDVEFDKNGVVVNQTGKLIAISGLAEDEEAKELLKPYKDKVDELAKQEIDVSTDVALENPRTNGDNTAPSVRKNETILGNLITDGMLAKAKEATDKKVIMALQNGGGIRAAIEAGPITVGEVITVLPFGNTLAVMDVTGAELKEAFEISFVRLPGENGGFLHVAGGKVEFDSSRPAGERVVSVSYQDENGDYVPVQDDVTYTIATNAFTAQGGDGYTVFKKAYDEGRVKDLGLSDWENFAEHLQSLETIPTETEGRIVDVASDDLTTELPGGNYDGNDFSGSDTENKVYSADVTVNITDVSSLSNAVVKGNLTIIGNASQHLNISNIKVEGNLDLSGVKGDILSKLSNIEVTGDTIL